mgnify:CR=1 FL=1
MYGSMVYMNRKEIFMFPNNFNQLYGCSPFYTFAIQNFPFIEKDLDALTDYQLMCKIFKYLDDKIKEVRLLTLSQQIPNDAKP